VSRIVIGSAIVDNPKWAAQLFAEYPGKIAAGIDAMGGKVAIHGWKKVTNIDAVMLARQCEKAGAAAVVYTDISRDGKLQGANVDAMQAMAKAVRVPVIASGGVTTIADIKGLAAAGCQGAIIGRALYDGKINLSEAIEAARMN
jgi:phosphoribosylformimino-5-aminoimidazole carboxamide ribotide isomerase